MSKFFKQLRKIKDQEERTDLIYSTFDDMFYSGDFITSNEILSQIVVDDYSVSDLLSFISISCSAKETLKNRLLLIEKAIAKYPDKKELFKSYV